MNHHSVYLKLTQHCKLTASIFKNGFKKLEHMYTLVSNSTHRCCTSTEKYACLYLMGSFNCLVFENINTSFIPNRESCKQLNVYPQTGIVIVAAAVVERLSHVSLQPHGLHAAHEVSLSFIISWSLLKLMFIDSVMLFNHLLLCHPLLLLPSILPSIRGFSKESAFCIR